ncbi:hypothetical protein CLU79DRAFT_728364 [Phycomyces nitens]|nr:hypothetical protein CLU79DRAFT_728364 [Phycomyces nitens]
MVYALYLFDDNCCGVCQKNKCGKLLTPSRLPFSPVITALFSKSVLSTTINIQYFFLSLLHVSWAGPLLLAFIHTLSLNIMLEKMYNFPERTSTESRDDPSTYAPHGSSINDKAIWENATMRGWIIKHQPPSFSFTSQKKPRYLILSDRMIYTFKTDQQTPHFKEFFELTKSTHVFVTDQFTGVPHCLEVRKSYRESYSWFLQAPDAPTMMLWLERLKKTLFWLRTDPIGTASLEVLANINIEENYGQQFIAGNQDLGDTPPLTPGIDESSSWDVHSSNHQSWAPSAVRCRLPAILPPQPPPPTTRPPPIPSEYTFIHARSYR